MTLQIEAGKTYLTADGHVRGPMEFKETVIVSPNGHTQTLLQCPALMTDHVFFYWQDGRLFGESNDHPQTIVAEKV